MLEQTREITIDRDSDPNRWAKLDDKLQQFADEVRAAYPYYRVD